MFISPMVVHMLAGYPARTTWRAHRGWPIPKGLGLLTDGWGSSLGNQGAMGLLRFVKLKRMRYTRARHNR